MPVILSDYRICNLRNEIVLGSIPLAGKAGMKDICIFLDQAVSFFHGWGDKHKAALWEQEWYVQYAGDKRQNIAQIFLSHPRGYLTAGQWSAAIVEACRTAHNVLDIVDDPGRYQRAALDNESNGALRNAVKWCSAPQGDLQAFVVLMEHSLMQPATA